MGPTWTFEECMYTPNTLRGLCHLLLNLSKLVRMLFPELLPADCVMQDQEAASRLALSISTSHSGIHHPTSILRQPVHQRRFHWTVVKSHLRWRPFLKRPIHHSHRFFLNRIVSCTHPRFHLSPSLANVRPPSFNSHRRKFLNAGTRRIWRRWRELNTT